MAKQCCNTKNLTIILPNSLKRTQIYIAYNKYLCLLRHIIIMMHFGNGDKPNSATHIMTIDCGGYMSNDTLV